jgi:hypothetical protein
MYMIPSREEWGSVEMQGFSLMQVDGIELRDKGLTSIHLHRFVLKLFEELIKRKRVRYASSCTTLDLVPDQNKLFTVENRARLCRNYHEKSRKRMIWNIPA